VRGCLTCVRVCPYEVPVIGREVKKAKIEPAAARGVAYASAVPGEGHHLHHYTDAQILAKEEALFVEVS